MQEPIAIDVALQYANNGTFIQDIEDSCSEGLDYYFSQEIEDYPYHA